MPTAEPKTPEPKPKKKRPGGWPQGRRRNADSGKWSRTILALRALIEEHSFRGRISYQACALALGVDPKTVARWRDGIDRPPIETQELLTQWIAERRTELKQKHTTKPHRP